MIKKISLVTLSAVLIVFSMAFSMEIERVTLPDSLVVEGKNLILNGVGLRKKAFVKVYAGGLYLLEKNNTAEKIITADEPMTIRMCFIYDGVSGAKLIEAWNEGFKNAAGGNIASIKKEIDAFNACFTEEAKKNDIYDITYVPDQGVKVTIKGKLKGTVKGIEFKKAVFSIWLGEKPADAGLKKGMLGEP